MLVIASNKKWHNKLLKCHTVQERNALILSSGTRAVSCHFDLKLGEEFFRAAIGEFFIHSESKDGKELIFNNEADAIAKGKELRALLEFEQTVFNLATDLKQYGKVEKCEVVNGALEVKLTEGFGTNAIKTFNVMILIHLAVGHIYCILNRCVTDDNLFDCRLTKQ